MKEKSSNRDSELSTRETGSFSSCGFLMREKRDFRSYENNYERNYGKSSGVVRRKKKSSHNKVTVQLCAVFPQVQVSIL